MAVQNIEQYRRQNGIDILKVYTKPTKKFPNGACFYADADAIDLVENHTWWLNQKGNSIYVKSCIFLNNCRFHQELFYLKLGYYVACIDHVNGICIDNITQNLNIVTNSQNKFNIFTKGYSYRNKDNSFQSSICLNSKIYYPFSIVRREDEICIQRNDVEQNWLREKMQNDYYMFDFKKYRRGSEDILDLERTGVISEDEAVYQHIMRYAENAWYYLRFGLQDYFKDNHIPIPKYKLDENGFMVHPITGESLCPF